MVDKKIIRSRSNSTGLQILDTIAVPDRFTPSYYIFNYVGGGYSIISADKRVEPILSFSDNGYFPKSGNLPLGLINWLSVNHKRMQQLRKNPALKAPPAVAKLWRELSTTPSARKKVVDFIQPPPCEDTWTSKTVGPLLQTKWAQGYPYNLLCPTGNYQGLSHMPSGCVATAMAQVMYYWKSPAKYNWSIMPLTSIYPGNNSGNIAVAQLMLDLGTSVDMDYANDGSNPHSGFLNPATSCTDAFKNTFHYTSSSEGDFDYIKVQNNLNAHQPVLLLASLDNHSFLFWNWYNEGHEWVCDGYLETTFTGCPGEPVLGQSNLYFDMNWGWNEAGVINNVNGWYGFSYWQVYNGSTLEYYQYNQEMTYNIHP